MQALLENSNYAAKFTILFFGMTIPLLEYKTLKFISKKKSKDKYVKTRLKLVNNWPKTSDSFFVKFSSLDCVNNRIPKYYFSLRPMIGLKMKSLF